MFGPSDEIYLPLQVFQIFVLLLFVLRQPADEQEDGFSNSLYVTVVSKKISSIQISSYHSLQQQKKKGEKCMHLKPLSK